MIISGPQQYVPIVRVVSKPTKELGVADVVLGGLGLTGVLLIGALLFGVLLGGLFIWFKHRRPDNPFNGQASQKHGLQITATSLDPRR
ncbi:MAG: hypothetical protein ACM3NQ_04950 [Bacteroidales bacterium]